VHKSDTRWLRAHPPASGGPQRDPSQLIQPAWSHDFPPPDLARALLPGSLLCWLRLNSIQHIPLFLPPLTLILDHHFFTLSSFIHSLARFLLPPLFLLPPPQCLLNTPITIIPPLTVSNSARGLVRPVVVRRAVPDAAVVRTHRAAALAAVTITVAAIAVLVLRLVVLVLLDLRALHTVDAVVTHQPETLRIVLPPKRI
jgi:hypothetical protein